MSGKIDLTNKTNIKIGIFGGSFDPVHLGHTGLAEDAMAQAGLDKVIFIPARLQPFKLDKELATGRDRLEMLKLAAANIQGFEISSYEMEQEGVSYSYLTMRAMQKSFGEEAKLYFITGTDAFLKIDKWKKAEELLSNYAFIIGTRPGYKQEELKLYTEKIHDRFGTEILNIDNVQFDVSSTEIRRRLECGMPVDDLISAEVERYIKENGLYR